MTRTLAKQSGMRFADLDKGRIPDDVLKRVPAEFAHEQGILPLKDMGGRLVVAIDDPLKSLLADQLRFMLGQDVVCALAAPAALKWAIERA